MTVTMKRLELMLLTLTYAVSCLAQTNQPANSTTTWNHLTNQVHLSAYVSNNLVVAGSNIDVYVRISNASTNGLGVPRREFGGDPYLPTLRIELISKSGQINVLATGEPAKVFGHGPVTLWGGTTNDWKVPVDITTNIASGNYKLRLTQIVCFMDRPTNQWFDLEADLQLKVK